jgi:hypothetical protein
MYYFAYGSNINYTHFIKFISPDDILVIGPAYVENYIFKYRNILNSKLRSGVANIEYRNNSKVYGIIYYIKNKSNIEPLDKKEGYYGFKNEKNKYDKINIKCKTLKKNIEISCTAYVINNSVKGNERKPRLEYSKLLENGGKMHCLPKYYSNRIRYIFT